MNHVVQFPNAPVIVNHGRLEVHQIPVWQDNLVWVLVCTATGDAAVVDGPEAAPVLSYCRENEIRLTTILNTHTHRDHIGINLELDQMGRLDEFRVFGSGHCQDGIPGLTDPVYEGDSLYIGEVECQVWLTEGHINGHVSYLLGDALFCGDTLFCAGCGYLFDGPPAKMHASLARFASLPDDTLVFCAHEYTQDNLRFAWSVEPDNRALKDFIIKTWERRTAGFSVVPSTIGLERQINPFMRTQSETIRSHISGLELDDVDVFTKVRELKNTKAYRNGPQTSFPVCSDKQT